MAYDAFISYSHAADSRLAPSLQNGLQRLGSLPMLLGAAARMGFIGEPFDNDDYLQHIDEVN